MPQVRAHRQAQSEQTKDRASEGAPSRRDLHQSVYRRELAIQTTCGYTGDALIIDEIGYETRTILLQRISFA